jgi:hypothetical protein
MQAPELLRGQNGELLDVEALILYHVGGREQLQVAAVKHMLQRQLHNALARRVAVPDQGVRTAEEREQLQVARARQRESAFRGANERADVVVRRPQQMLNLAREQVPDRDGARIALQRHHEVARLDHSHALPRVDRHAVGRVPGHRRLARLRTSALHHQGHHHRHHQHPPRHRYPHTRQYPGNTPVTLVRYPSNTRTIPRPITLTKPFTATSASDL